MIDSILISSGLSSRMGSFKPVLEYRGLPFILNIIYKLLNISNSVTVVVGHEKELLKKVIERISLEPALFKKFLQQNSLNEYSLDISKLKIVENKDYLGGMFTSLKKGVTQIEGSKILYHFVDQPHLPLEFYQNFIHQYDTNYDWFQPRYNGRNGHPIIFNDTIKDLIIKEPNNSNLRKVINSENINKGFWACDYSQVLEDFDTPTDFANIC